MPYVVTIEDVRVPARFTSPPSPWIAARIAEAESPEGPFGVVDTIVLAPVDADPTDPARRSFTTSAATLPAGWYRVELLDAAGAEYALPPVRNVVDGVLGDLTPTVQDVADLLRSRTRDADTGAELGTFTASTRPTAGQVEALIARSARTVALRVGKLPGDAVPAARQTAALGAALLVELSYFPEQVATDRSPYAELKALHDEQLRSVAALGMGGGSDEPGNASARGVTSTPVGTLVDPYSGGYPYDYDPSALLA